MDLTEKMNQLKGRTSQLKKSREFNLSLIEVDNLVDEIMHTYNAEDKFRPWYCKVVYKLGPKLVKSIMARVSDARKPERLFSKIVKEKLLEIENSRINNE